MRTSHLGIAAVAALALLVTGCASAQPGSTGAPTTTADPAPSESAPATPTPTPTPTPSPSDSDDDMDDDATPIPDAQIAALDVMDAVSTDGAAALWAEPGTSLAVFIGGSGSSRCVPEPDGAEVEDGAIVVEFTAPDLSAISCTADFRVYGWTFPIDGPVDASMPVDVRVEGLSPDASSVVELSVGPDALLP
ncbi:hypothetical protein [Agrococcus terreus]|uniref:LppP/LprE lipoprotein n=1 Tax=Agrococcus terreus TaxID=574649 RepID=A0ABQ2KR08_9MICO|nr:hypothetical protein [Agrococcus terreus]GGN87528.1 hypothetical protein GCM10010968_22160 [Agrococcus terreus]